MDSVAVREASLEEIVGVHNSIEEWDKWTKENFSERLTESKERVLQIAYCANLPVGYIVAYDRFHDGSLYIWMTGVIKEFRRKGILRLLMAEVENYCKVKSIKNITIKTRNNRREMLGYLIKTDWDIIAVEQKLNPKDNRILLRKLLN
jgi:ribosomal protein S18 acetylase RimI-like enzyme